MEIMMEITSPDQSPMSFRRGSQERTPGRRGPSKHDFMYTYLKINTSSSVGRAPIDIRLAPAAFWPALRSGLCEAANVFEKATAALSVVQLMVWVLVR
jgi:hypothetical protein